MAPDEERADGEAEASRCPRLPGLRLLRRIGQGAYGEVWIAENRITHGMVAAKIIPLTGSHRGESVARELASLVRYEAGVRGEHPNLVTIHHVGRTDEFLYYTMDVADHLDGSRGSADADFRPATLRARMEQGVLTTEEVWRLAEALLCGLARIHEAGLAHRDIKPENCLFIRGELKLADFGLLTHTDSTVSRVGTPQYMPPDGRMDARADVYAAGLVIYEMLTGLPASAFPRLPSRVASENLSRKCQILNHMVLKACSRDPSRRFGDAAEMLRALRHAQVEPATRRPHRRVLVLAAVLLLMLGSSFAVILSRRSSASTVDVNFITEPFEAEIYVDGAKLRDANHEPYRTPCTVLDLPRRPHSVTFRKDGLPDLAVGEVDFWETREVVAKWHTGDSP